MFKKLKKKQKTMAEKVAELISSHNESNSGSDSADETTAAKVIDYNNDEYELPSIQTTEFRKRNVKLLSEQNEKYKGKIVCRKDFDNDENEDEVGFEKSDTSDDEEALVTFSNNIRVRSKRKDSSDSTSENEGNKNRNEEEHNNSSSDHDSESQDEENEVIRKVNHEAEIQKGLCVLNQLHIWERLLEIRINLQKVLNKISQLPTPHELQDLENNDKHKEIKGSMCKQTSVVLQNLLSLKNMLCSQFPEVEKTMKPCLKRPFPFKDNTFEEPSFKIANQYLEDNFRQFNTYRNNVLLKWDDRTKLLQPGAGSEKKSFNEEYDIIKKIGNTLVNKTLLIEKSQQIKTTSQNETQQGSKLNPNIYDDSDFYHQQLRELIEYKSNTTSNMSEVTKQFLELQMFRQKMKKKVDTKASKGRKLRYIIHNKLINFMAPHDNYTWSIESTEELTKSLFV